MLDLNLDRLLMAVGTVMLGAVLLFGLIEMYPGIIGDWTYNMAGTVTSVEVAKGEEFDIINSDFSQFSEGWDASSGDVVFDGDTAYLPAHTALSTGLDIPNGADVRVTFRGRGVGSVRVQLENASRGDSFTDMSLNNNNYNYNATLRNHTSDGNRLIFKVADSSEFVLDEVWVTNLGVSNDYK